MTPLVTGFTQILEWFRVAGGIIGFITLALGIVLYYRISMKGKWTEALNQTVDIYQQQNVALDLRIKSMEDEHKLVIGQMQERERELITLRARTDLTEVLKSSQVMIQGINDLITDQRTHDTAITTVLKDAMTTGQQQYREMMELMNRMLIHLSETSKDNLSQSQKNYALIEVVVNAITSLSRRFGGVEAAVNGVAEQVGSEQVKIDPPEPTNRRKNPR